MQNEIFHKNQLLEHDGHFIRILETHSSKVFLIDCLKRNMPEWREMEEVKQYVSCPEIYLQEVSHIFLSDISDAESKKIMYERFTMISPVLPFVTNVKKRNEIIHSVSVAKGISKQTIRYYLCLYLAYQDISVLAPKENRKNVCLSQDEKNMRWALNKFFYTKHKNSLNTAYLFLLKEKYCDAMGNLLPEYPSFYQFRYFYRKTKKMQTYYISRNGLKDYQKNNRPLLGDGIQEYASSVGMGMLDATVCDIYLVNDAGKLAGRPILTVCIDAYSSLCCGYLLSWEGGVYSLRGLMLNIIQDKQKWCKKHGIFIEKSQWDSNQLPAYRPELKGAVEKFFDLIQNTYKPHLKGKGVIEADYQERGAHDYRKDACLTMEDFEKVILHCIIYYNSHRMIENFPYTEEMIKNQIPPFANTLWEWGRKQSGANLITVNKEQLILTLLPRTTGEFSRVGLKVNQMRYKNEDYTERYLTGGKVTVSYNPDDVTVVWLKENGSFIPFTLIESRYSGKKLAEVEHMKKGKKELVKKSVTENIQAQIHLAQSIEMIASSVKNHKTTEIKECEDIRQREKRKNRINNRGRGYEND